jgi:hypothetical protein
LLSLVSSDCLANFLLRLLLAGVFVKVGGIFCGGADYVKGCKTHTVWNGIAFVNMEMIRYHRLLHLIVSGYGLDYGVVGLTSSGLRQAY